MRLAVALSISAQLVLLCNLFIPLNGQVKVIFHLISMFRGLTVVLYFFFFFEILYIQVLDLHQF